MTATVEPGLMLLRLAPLMGSTAFVTVTVCEDVFLRPIPRLGLDARAITAYRDFWFPRTLALVLVLYCFTIVVALANLFVGPHALVRVVDDKGLLTARLYLAGAVFAMLHFAFGIKDLAILKRMSDDVGGKVKEDDGEGRGRASQSAEAVRAWTRMNVWRGVAADLPAFLCFLVGFLLL